MKTTSPPKDFDLTANLFNEPGYIPAKGTTTKLKTIREGYKRGELTALLQERGLLFIRGLMLSSEFTEDSDAKVFARKYGAVMLLGGAWHSFAEDRLGPSEEGFEGTRRRLKLYDFTKFGPTNRPSSDSIHSAATERLGDCISAAGNVVSAVREGYSSDMLEARTRVGRLMGNTALHIAAVPLGDTLQAMPAISRLDMQVSARHEAEAVKNDAVALSTMLRYVPAPAPFADPLGNELASLLDRTMPTHLADMMQQLKADLPLV